MSFIPSEEIEASANNFIKKYHQKPTLPIPIEEIIDFQMGLRIVPVVGLLTQVGIDCFISLDQKELYIDQNEYESSYNRARFSLAHEIGHIVLHGDYLRSLKIDSIPQWKRTVLGKGKGHAPMETQANMFAGFLLMPSAELQREFERQKRELKKSFFDGRTIPDDKTLAPYLAKSIARIFEVSEGAANNRLLNWINCR